MMEDRAYNYPLERYGSVVATHLLNEPDLAARISSVILVDPISILLNQPDVAYNFVRLLLMCTFILPMLTILPRQFADQSLLANGYCGISGPRI